MHLGGKVGDRKEAQRELNFPIPIPAKKNLTKTAYWRTRFALRVRTCTTKA